MNELLTPTNPSRTWPPNYGVCIIPTVASKLKPLIEAIRIADANAKAQPSADNKKAAKAAQDRYDHIYFGFIETDEDEMCDYIWEQYHKCRNKQDRKILKERYNALANKINTKAKRKIWLLIH